MGTLGERGSGPRSRRCGMLVTQNLKGESMLCTEVQGNINDPSVVIALQRRLGGEFDVDFVDFEWDEVRGRIHRKRSVAGRDVGVRLGDWVLERGLADGDVLGAESAPAPAARPVVVAVRLLSARCLVIDVDPAAPLSLARTAWEVGNMHVPLFRGEGEQQLVAPYSDPLVRMLSRVPAVTLHDAQLRLDPARRLSGNGISAVVRLANDIKIVVRKCSQKTAADAGDSQAGDVR